jgi:hypothetical protein
MKLITYTLEADGTVPAYVVDGGYFADTREGPSPQDWTLVGWATDDAPGDEVTDLRAYLVSLGAESWTDAEGEPFDIDAAVAYVEGLGAAA